MLVCKTGKSLIILVEKVLHMQKTMLVNQLLQDLEFPVLSITHLSSGIYHIAVVTGWERGGQWGWLQ